MTTLYIIVVIALLIFSFIIINRKSGGLSFTNVSVSDLGLLLKDKNTELIDVRTQKEINQGIITELIAITRHFWRRYHFMCPVAEAGRGAVREKKADQRGEQ